MRARAERIRKPKVRMGCREMYLSRADWDLVLDTGYRIKGKIGDVKWPRHRGSDLIFSSFCRCGCGGFFGAGFVPAVI